jgi:RNA polymerase sigma factor (TIGR02999 family)
MPAPAAREAGSLPSRVDHLASSVYAELRRLAGAKMGREAAGHTLQATALVHEAWMRLRDKDGRQRFENRAHFFGAAAEAMRRILIESARRKRAVRHGAGLERVELDAEELAIRAKDDQLLAVDEALDKMTAEHPDKAELVKLRYFVGLTIEDSADALGISVATAKRHWVFARAWLYDRIQQGKG